MLSRALISRAVGVPRVVSGAFSVTQRTGSSDATSNRPVRMEPGKVRLGFIPEEWFQFFYKKTGVTGPYTFGVGLMTYLCSKEIYVMEHEYYSGLSLAIMCVVVVKKMGPTIAKYLDSEVDKEEEEWNKGRSDELKARTDTIESEKLEQWRANGSLMLMDAKKENIALQLEAAFRERSMNVYNEVKRRLDYQVECQHVERRLNQKHMVNWIVNSVLSSITPQQEKDTLSKCFADLNALAARSK